jgi:hypothetical protein
VLQHAPGSATNTAGSPEAGPVITIGFVAVPLTLVMLSGRV